MTEKRPTVDDVDPSVMAVDSTPDEVRLHGDTDETDQVQLGDGALMPSDQDEDTDEKDEAGH